MGQRVLPHMGDEALIMFENSQSQRPVIVGFLYNELTKPPFNLKKNPYLMGIKTSYNAMSLRMWYIATIELAMSTW